MALLDTLFGPMTNPWTMQPDNNDPVGVAALKGGLLYNPNNFQQGQPQFGATGGFDGAMPQPANPYGGLPSRDALGPQMPQAPAAPQNIPIPQQTDVAWSPQFQTPDETASTADANANPDVPAKNAQPVAMTTPQTPQQQSSGGGLFDMLSNIYGKGGPGDPLIALGMGMIGKRHIGEGLQQGFENMNRQQLVQATTANQRQKLAQSQASLQGRVQSILAKNPNMPANQAQAIASNDALWQAWAKNNIDGLSSEQKPQLVTVTNPDGTTQQKWMKPGEPDGVPVGAPQPAGSQNMPATVQEWKFYADQEKAAGREPMPFGKYMEAKAVKFANFDSADKSDLVKYLADRDQAGDTSWRVGMSKEPGLIKAVQAELASRRNAGTSEADPAAILQSRANQAGRVKEQGTLGTSTANNTLYGNAAAATIDTAISASREVPRTDWVPINKLVQGGEAISSNPKLAEFRTALMTTVNDYAKATTPTGTPTDSQRAHAYEVLNTAVGPEGVEGVLRMMHREIANTHRAIELTKSQLQSGHGGPLPDLQAPPAGPNVPGSQSAGIWDTVKGLFGGGTSAPAQAPAWRVVQ